MAAKRKVPLPPFYIQFVYDVIYKASIEDKKRIPIQYIKACKNSSSIQKFLDRAMPEQIDEILLHLGVQWCKVYFDKKDTDKRYLKNIFSEYITDNGGYGALLANLIKNRVYVTNDKQFALHLGLVSHLENNSIYTQQLLLNKAGFHLEKWKKDNYGDGHNQILEQNKITKYLVSTILNAIQYYEICTSVTKYSQNETKVLLYLYTKEHKYLKKERIIQRFAGEMSGHKVAGCLRRLYQLQALSKNTKGEYQIAALGILAVNDFFGAVLKSNNILD